MRVNLNTDQIDWLQKNCLFEELTIQEQGELDDSIPDISDDGVEWQCPAFASVLVRDRFMEFYQEQQRLLGEMNVGIVTGTFSVSILGTKVN